MTTGFSDYYPPGTTGREPELTGVWPCEYCHREISDLRSCQREDPVCTTDRHAADHCPECCPLQDEPESDN